MDALVNYCLLQADNNLILSQRNAEWCGHGPILEQDIAITNISLDLLGQARYFYQYASELKGGKETEDSLAYLRTEREFRNCLLVEQPRGDWAFSILRQFFYSVYQLALYDQLQKSPDKQLAAISAKAIKEVEYHVRWSGEWVVRLGDGTTESRERLIKALNELWRFTGELFTNSSIEKDAYSDGFGVDVSTIKAQWTSRIDAVFNEAGIPVPGETFMQLGGKEGNHSEHLGYILAEMQYLQRAYPGAEW